MTNYYNNTPITPEQAAKATQILHRDGWEYQEDRFYPVTDNRRMGWWVNTYGGEEYEQHRYRRGDSKPFVYATQLTYRLYSGHSDEEIGAGRM